MSAHQVIGYTPEIGKALKRILAETPQTDTGKLSYKKGKKQQLFQGRKKTLDGNFEYNGYFKIIDASEYDEKGDLQKVIIKVVDGKTYSAETGESESMLYYTNGNPGQVQSATIELPKKAQMTGLMLHVSAFGNANIETYIGNPPSQTPHHFYKAFGRVKITYATVDGKNVWLVNIYQDHDKGVLEGIWYAICGVFT